MKTVVVVGATGATGKHVVKQLVEKKKYLVKALVRDKSKVPVELADDSKFLELVEGSILDLDPSEVESLVKDAHVVSCLGHNPTLSGMFGSKDKHLCYRATTKLFDAMNNCADPASQSKLVVMNSVGVRVKNEAVTWGESFVFGLLRYLVPPHFDNEQTGRFFLDKAESKVPWVVVRPDGLIDAPVDGQYQINESPPNSLFNAKSVRRSNVAHFMVSLIDDESFWETWKKKFPTLLDSNQLS